MESRFAINGLDRKFFSLNTSIIWTTTFTKYEIFDEILWEFVIPVKVSSFRLIFKITSSNNAMREIKKIQKPF